MSTTRDILEGLRSDAATFAGFTLTSIFYKELPATGDRVMAITPYAALDEPTVAAGRVRVQFFFRSRPDKSLDVDDDADALFAWLHGLTDRQWGEVHLVQAFRVSSVPLGIDTAKRTLRTDNYELDCDFPLTTQRPF